MTFDSAFKPDPEAVEVIKHMATELVEGPKPEWLFLCAIGSGVLTFQASKDEKPVILLFMTPFAAIDYLTATNTQAQVCQVKFEAVPELALQWKAAEQAAVALNRCPRCPMFVSTPVTEIADPKKFVSFWAIRRATQLYFGQRTVRQYMVARDNAEYIAALELIRDHIDCGVPYVYELLASFAHVARDDAAKHTALEQLKMFGPQFANWEKKWDLSSTETYARAMLEAYVGLCLSFGIQLKELSAEV